MVRHTASGVCASSVHAMVKYPLANCPCVLGHDGVGIVIHAGGTSHTRSYTLEQFGDALADLGEGRILGRSIVRF